MRVLILSWEFPPLVVGGLGRHVGALSRSLVAAGHEVRVVTRGDSAAAMTSVVDGVRVTRAAVDPIDVSFTTESLLSWSFGHEHALLRAALPLVREWQPDVVHAHDWLTAQSGITLAATTGAPLVVTMHATERGRHRGWLSSPLNRAIHSVERWQVRSADEVIVCSRAMQAEVGDGLDTDQDRIVVVPNGVDVDAWRAPRRRAAEMRTGLGAGPLVMLAARLVHEKGGQDLIAAMPAVRRRHPGARLIIAGSGPHEDELRADARRRRVPVTWVGFVPDDELAVLLAAADVAVVPSLYEPFGLIALEAQAAGTAVVASDVGGLADLVVDGCTGLLVPPGQPRALAAALDQLLADPALRASLARRARRRVRREFTWAAVAESTAAVYAAAVDRHAAPADPDQALQQSRNRTF